MPRGSTCSTVEAVTSPPAEVGPSVAADPLWPIVQTLAAIAERIERRRAEEVAPDRRNGSAAGGDPAAHEEAA